jgi:hypothetical protein
VGDAEPLGVRADPSACGLPGQADVVEDRVNAVTLDAKRHRGDGERLLAGPSAVLGRSVEQHADVAAGVRDGAVWSAEDRRPSVRRLAEPADHPERGGLAGSVRSDEARDGARHAAEGDVADRGQRAVALGEVLDLDRAAEACLAPRDL